MKQESFSLTISQSTILKAWGIILIAFHNFFHQLEPKFFENEFSYRDMIFPNHVAFVMEYPLEIIRSLFSFYGHLGVSVFIVLSAYGLTKQYGGKSPEYVSFLLKRLWKLYPIFIIAILVHALTITWWRPEPWSDWALAYLAKLSLLTNFIPGLETKVVGPWWFFSFIVQYYVVFKLIDKFAEKAKFWGLVGLALLGWFSIYLIDPLIPIRLKFTVVGWLPEIALGVALAKGYWCRQTALVFVVALIVFIAGHFSREAWVFQSFSFSVLFFLIASKIIGFSESSPMIARPIALIGALSFPLFATHGPLRVPFQKLVEFNDTWWFSIAMSVAFFCTALLVAFLSDRLNQRLMDFRVK